MTIANCDNCDLSQSGQETALFQEVGHRAFRSLFLTVRSVDCEASSWFFMRDWN